MYGNNCHPANHHNHVNVDQAYPQYMNNHHFNDNGSQMSHHHFPVNNHQNTQAPHHCSNNSNYQNLQNNYQQPFNGNSSNGYNSHNTLQQPLQNHQPSYPYQQQPNNYSNNQQFNDNLSSNYSSNGGSQYLLNSHFNNQQVDHYNNHPTLQSNQMNHYPQGNPPHFMNNNPNNNSPSPYHNNYNNTGPVVMPAANKIHSNNNSSHNHSHQNAPNKHQSPTKPKQNVNQSSNNKSSPQKNIKAPEKDCFCNNWKECPLTKDEDHRSEFKHMCTIKNCTLWKDNKIHKGRFIHVCEHGKDCRYQDNEEHTHNFIHPCKFNHKCRYLSDPLHRIRFSHDLKSALGSGDSIGWPDSWTYSPPKPIATLTKNSNNNYVRVVDLSVSSDEYKKISNKFLKSVNHSYAQAQVKKIERIEHAELWNDYACLRLEIKHKNGGNANEQHLYHGGDSATLQQIIDTGFDYRLCSKGNYGQGSYFAVNASYSHGYTVVNPSTNERVMLLCKVAIGEPMVVQQPNSSLKRPYDSSAQKMYDSVKGNQTGTEYVIFDNKQAYPEYRITYV
ncbi:hypothetical protein ABK040_014299 [Willaertia magna]